MPALIDLTIAEVAPLLAQGEVSPVDLVGAVLDRIEACEHRVNAYITVSSDEAMAAAKEAERTISTGEYVSPLHGIPISLKDNIWTHGVRTTAGSAILTNFVPNEDATVVAKLKSAGAIVLGKNNMHEFALGVTTDNPHYGSSRNPWDLTRIVGGSSGGSGAAVSARESLASLGTDTGGSLRLPAALNGVSGIRPTFGRVSNYGVVPLAWTSDTVGPICRSVVDCALVLEAISGPDARDPSTARRPVPPYSSFVGRDIRGMRAGLIRAFSTMPVEKSVAIATEEALKKLTELGMELVEVEIHDLEVNDAAQAAVELSESSAYHQRWLQDLPEHYGADVRPLLEVGARLRAASYVQAQRYRSYLRAQFNQVFERLDVIVSPMTPFVAPRLGQERVVLGGDREEDMLTAMLRYANLASLAGLPAISVPCGFSEAGLPIGLQFMGPAFQETVVLQVAGAYQTATSWHARTPPLP